MKKILGLDLGTNSIGWALVEIDHKNGLVKIIGLGSRILPMDAREIGDFESKGTIKSSAAARTEKRGPRRMNERYMLRRDRLHLVLDLLDALPSHYKLEIDLTRTNADGIETRSGQFRSNAEPKLAYVFSKENPDKKRFIFEEAYNEMLSDMGIYGGKGCRVPKDWTLYYLRMKALDKEITLEQLAWVLLSYNQKRGYEKLDVEDKSTKDNEIVEELDLQVDAVESRSDKDGQHYYEVQLSGNDGFVYKELVDKDRQMTFEKDLKEIIKVSKVDEQGNIDPKKTEFKVVDIYTLVITKVEHHSEKGKHSYTLTYDNGWTEKTGESAKYTFKYKDALNKPFDYVVETVYDIDGNIKKQQGKERKLREPDFGDNSSDWTLLKKRTEKDALEFNAKEGYVNADNSVRNFISPRIYATLKEDVATGRRTKVIGGRFQVVERKFYREELKQIISTQRKFHQGLNDDKVFEKCVQVLYPKNESHANSLLNNKDAIEHLLVDDILLYQRPLKTKKSEIDNCKYEVKRVYEKVDEKTGEIKKTPIYLKVVSVSHPYFQEFRIWDKLHSLKLIQLEKKVNGKLSTNVDVTAEYFDPDVYQKLFDKLNGQKSLTKKQFLAFCKSQFKIKDIKNFDWNFSEDEELKGNETRVNFVTRISRCGLSKEEVKEFMMQFLTQEKELELWHYLYSVNYKERKENNGKSINTFFNRFLEGSGIAEDIKQRLIIDFTNYPKFASKYCAYSEKALKKLLPFMRMGENRFTGKFDLTGYEADLKAINYKKKGIPAFIGSDKMGQLSSEERQGVERRKQALHEALWKHSINKRIEEILHRLDKIDFNAESIDYSVAVSNVSEQRTGELPFPKGLFNAFRGFHREENFTSLNLTRASYLVYGRHSELAEAKYWRSPDMIRHELHRELKQHSLNNPVAEKVLLETMQVVADIWEYYGNSSEKFFSEIHVEVGRELKKSAKQKLAASKSNSENRKQNKRLRKVLEEFFSKKKYGAKPKNSDHFARLKIVEDAARNQLGSKEFFEGKDYTRKEIEAILSKPYIGKADFEKYKLWMEQGYKSPYTNRIIKLTDLFDGNKYNIDHVFPQASVTNDSLSNKVVCETEVNKLKSDQTGRAFVNEPKNRKPYCAAHGCEVEIVNDETYVSIIKRQFSGSKKHILLSREIPKEFTNSQLNNARHIARKAMELLSHIVREEGEVEFLSKNVLPITGAVTGKLKKAWRLDQVWKELVAPRYIRMNKLTESSLFGQERMSKSGHTYFDCNLDEIIREKDDSYDIKRIDHRHHALDALIVALCTRDHVNYINNINADASSDNYGRQKQIEAHRVTLKKKIKFTKKEDENDGNNWYYMLPGHIRQLGDRSSSIKSVLTKTYAYKDDMSFQADYRKMILAALQHTVVTFKQNMRVINKTVNRYNRTPNGKVFAIQDEKKTKYNWAIRRSLSKASYYGKVDLGETEMKQLHKYLPVLFSSPDLIVDELLKARIKTLTKEKNTYTDFASAIRSEFPNRKIKLRVLKLAKRQPLDITFNRSKIKTITDTGIQKILLRHLEQFDTVRLPFDEAIAYVDATIQTSELESIWQNPENGFDSISELTEYLKTNNYRFDKVDYSNLDVFVDQVTDRDFRNDEQYKKKIEEHPEIAFTAEKIDSMNQAERLIELNEGKKHCPIRKVRVSSGFGKQRQVNNDENSVKSKQYVATDGHSNLYLGFYKGIVIDKDGNEVLERRFEDIGLLDLISVLKQEPGNRHHPLPEKIYDKGKNEFTRIFTLSPLDLVFVPSESEIENPALVNFDNLNADQTQRIYKCVDFGFNDAGILQTNFIPFNFSKTINIGELKIDDTTYKGEITLTTAKNKQQKSLENFHEDLPEKTMIREVCWKLETDRLGNITNVIR